MWAQSQSRHSWHTEWIKSSSAGHIVCLCQKLLYTVGKNDILHGQTTRKGLDKTRRHLLSVCTHMVQFRSLEDIHHHLFFLSFSFTRANKKTFFRLSLYLSDANSKTKKNQKKERKEKQKKKKVQKNEP
jgi:hypothetical protein